MTGDDFDTRIVVSSAKTVADIPALMCAISQLHEAMRDLQACHSELEALANRTGTLTGEHIGNASVAAESIGRACSVLLSSSYQLARFIDSLAYTALIYSAAEGDAATFAQLRAWLYPSPLSYFEAGPLTAPFTFATIADLPRGRSRPWRQVWPGSHYREIWPRPFHLSVGYAAIYGTIFGSGVGSDPVDSLALQFHIEDISRSLMRSTHWFEHGSTPSGQMLGPHATSATPEAAAIAGGAFFGWGRLLNGSRRSIILGRPGRGAQDSPAPLKPGPRTLRLPLRAQSSVWSRTLIPGAPGFSGFLNLGQSLGTLPEGMLTASASGSSSSYDEAGRSSLAPESKSFPPTHTPREVATPHAPSALIERIGNLAEGKEYGEFEILKHETQGPKGSEYSWSIIIRGTQEWTAGTTNIQDMHTNFNAIAGVESDQTRAIKAAMADMGIQPTEAVEFVGHSQGGIVAAQLASDTEICNRYTVAAVLTAGSPTAGYTPVTSVGMLNLENTRDQVPALDGRENVNRGNNLTVHFDGRSLNLQTLENEEVFAHDMTVYREAMAHFESAPTVATAEISAWMEARERALGLGEGTHTTSYVYTTQRSSW